MVFSRWFSKRTQRRQSLRLSKELLTSLVQQDARGTTEGGSQSGNPAQEEAGRLHTPRQTHNQKTESDMFEYLEKKTHKRMFYSYLSQFELTLEHLGSKVSRQMVNMVHDESCKVARAFNEPLVAVSHNIISAAAWGTIYCLLGP